MLRPYQQKALDEIRELYSVGKKKVLLQLATGGGKTVVFCEILKSCHARNKRAVLLVRGRKLVDQASQRLMRESVPHGVLMAGHWNDKPRELIQVCSIDTVARRIDAIRDTDLIVVDETHMAASKSFREFIERFPNAYKLGVTATPFQRASITHVAEHVVNPITMIELIEQGYLVPPIYYAPSSPDLRDVKISRATGDYDMEQLSESCSTIVGSIPTNWIKYGEQRPTICFAVNIKHSHEIVSGFKAHGIPARHVDAESSDDERNEAIDDLEAGRIKVLSNVGIMCTGVDVPFVSCLIMARPTQSLNLYLQQAGRGTRPAPNKTDFLILDHGNNVARHGLINVERDAILEYKKKSATTLIPPVATCEKCYAVFPSRTKQCPSCGHENELSEREIVEIDGELKLLTSAQYELYKIRLKFNELKRLQSEKGYRRGWLYYKMKDEFGDAIAEQYVPARVIPDWLV